MLSLALDVARGMAALHSRNICHGDLAAKNVLLSRCVGGAPPLHVQAKVADFGLSRLLPQNATHLSTLTQGTITHQVGRGLRNCALCTILQSISESNEFLILKASLLHHAG